MTFETALSTPNYLQNDLKIQKFAKNPKRCGIFKDWGYLNGEELSGRNNYYHKPHIVLNHYYNMTENTSLNTSVYASYGKGGGSGPLGS